MANSELDTYIASLREKKIPDSVIKTELLKHGWAENIVNNALMPVNNNINLPPPPIPRVEMWVALQYFILFISLYVSATCLGGILHTMVDQYINSTGARNPSGIFGAPLMKYYLAGIIVTYPIFVALFILLKKEIIKRPIVKNVKERKSFIYLTLGATFIIMIIHLIGTVIGFLNGNTTLNSIAHLFVTFLVAGSIFVYFLNEVREDRKTND